MNKYLQKIMYYIPTSFLTLTSGLVLMLTLLLHVLYQNWRGSIEFLSLTSLVT